MTDLRLVQSGELAIDLEASTDELAPVALALAELERELRALRAQVETELLERMRRNDQRVAHLPSGHTLQLRTGRRRVWDPDELETVVRDLVDRGTVNPGAWTGLVRRETKVDGTLALRLLGQLDGTARRELEECFQWQDGRPSLKIIAPGAPAITATAEEDE